MHQRVETPFDDEGDDQDEHHATNGREIVIEIALLRLHRELPESHHDGNDAADKGKDDHLARCSGLADILGDIQKLDHRIQDAGLHQVAEGDHDDPEDQGPDCFMGVYHIACLLTGCEATTLCNFPDFISVYLYSSNRRERFKHKPRHQTSDVNSANGVTARKECLFRAGGGRDRPCCVVSANCVHGRGDLFPHPHSLSRKREREASRCGLRPTDFMVGRNTARFAMRVSDRFRSRDGVRRSRRC